MTEIFIIAGCYGAGKTTAAYNLLPDVFKTVEFVNSDEIARVLSPFNPIGVAFQAGRIMLERLKQLIESLHFPALSIWILLKRQKKKDMQLFSFLFI